MQTLQQLEGLYLTALNVLDNESDAQDVVQGSFARAYHSWLKCQVSPNCRVWLFRIMANALINKYRISPSLTALTNNANEIDGYLAYPQWVNQQANDNTGQIPFSAISLADVKKAIGELPDRYRLIVVLSLLEGFSYREIADIVGINQETVRSRLHHGHKLMQRELFDRVGCEGAYDASPGRVRSRRSGQ